MPRVHAELRAEGIGVGRKRIARLMQVAGLQGVSRRRFVGTTMRDERARPAPDLVQRAFTAEGPDRLWVADITSIPTWAGFSVPRDRARRLEPESRGPRHGDAPAD